ncbi:MAG: hypothetical protein KA603_05970 [Azonexus sp.]|nr:hypothetical protein [Betaproteobacteria bacterium]MBK8919808.1 hypothetical protein [Betaproteobacteria bacterium]MBP6035667.1 hypothetical protein [Azonexus sp.]MBP6906953.1 hypothetical protein [Azonexus sp.]
MFLRGATSAINHLLAGEPWAAERLRPFAGRRLRVELGALHLAFLIHGDGMFGQPVEDGAPDVVISLPSDSPLRFLRDPGAVLSSARLTGSADLAETLAFVFRNLRWDAEGDLARVIGDVAARRVAVAGRGLMAWHREALDRLLANLGDYATEDGGLAVPRREAEAFYGDCASLRDDLARLEKRLARL